MNYFRSAAGLLTDGGFVNLATNDTTPVRIDPATWRRIQKRTKSKTTLTSKSPAGNETGSPAGRRQPFDCPSQLSKIRVTNVRLHLLEPAARIGTVHDAPQVAEAFGYVVSVIENIFLGRSRIIGEERSHAPRFGERIVCVADVGSLSDHAALKVKDVLITK